MKRLVSLAVLLACATPAVAAPSYLTRGADGGYVVTYDYTDKAKTGWYIGARADLNFWNWKNEYSTGDNFNPVESYGSDEYSFEPAFGGSLFGGRQFAYFWRAELEAGYLGYFKDKDFAAEFTMQIPYVLLNGYYDFTNGLYLGAGVGAAMSITTLDMTWADGSERTEYNFSPMAGVMVGYSHELDNNLVLDIRYRLSGLMGGEQRINNLHFDDGSGATWFQNDIDFILDNSISVGIRYEF